MIMIKDYNVILTNREACAYFNKEKKIINTYTFSCRTINIFDRISLNGKMFAG